MKFVDVKVTINVDFGTMTLDQYKEFSKNFEKHIYARTQVPTSEIMESLDLDKRPFYVTSLTNVETTDALIDNAEINFVC